MIRIFHYLLMGVLLVLPQLSCAASITLDDKACGTAQVLSVGDMLEVRLPGNPTTGYLWQTASAPSLLRQQGEPVHHSDSQRIGAGGVTSFAFSATAAGDGILELIYHRPWEQNSPPLKTCSIQLKLQAIAKIRYPVVDNHLHFYDFTQQSDGFPALVKAMDQAGVDRAVVFGMPIIKMWPEHEPIRPGYYLDSDARAYYFSATDLLLANELLRQPVEIRERFLPFLGGINPLDQNAAEHLELVLKSYPQGFWKGIGEVMSRHDDLTAFTYGEPPRADHPALMKVYRLAAERKLPVLIHHNISSASMQNPIYLKELENALRENPRTRIIWAHAGISRRVVVPTLVAELRRVLSAYPNLSVDISWVVYPDYIGKDSQSLKIWAALLEDFPERFMIGSDKVAHWAGYRGEIRKYDPLLELLKPETARKVTRENILRIVDWK
jgi:predicted secreted protein